MGQNQDPDGAPRDCTASGSATRVAGTTHVRRRRSPSLTYGSGHDFVVLELATMTIVATILQFWAPLLAVVLCLVCAFPAMLAAGILHGWVRSIPAASLYWETFGLLLGLRMVAFVLAPAMRGTASRQMTPLGSRRKRMEPPHSHKGSDRVHRDETERRTAEVVSWSEELRVQRPNWL